MNEEEVKNIIYKILKKIAPETEPSKLTLDENIRETLNIDSFDGLQFVVALGDQLGIEISEEDYSKTTTMKNLLTYLKGKLSF